MGQITVESFPVQPSTDTPKLTKIRTLSRLSEQEGALVCGCFSEYREGGERVTGVSCDPVLCWRVS